MNRRSIALLGILFATFSFTTPTFASSTYRGCIRFSFPGNNLATMTNICNNNLYATWFDDNGEHVTAIGGGASANLGRIHGQIRFEDADPQ